MTLPAAPAPEGGVRPHARTGAVSPAVQTRCDGAVLLEVILASALFACSALILLAGLSASLRTADRVQVEAAGVDLVVSLLSEVQMGLVPLVDDGPNTYEQEDLADWTWEIAVITTEESLANPDIPPMLRVTVTVRNQREGYAHSLSQLMQQQDDTATAAAVSEPVDIRGMP